MTFVINKSPKRFHPDIMRPMPCSINEVMVVAGRHKLLLLSFTIISFGIMDSLTVSTHMLSKTLWEV